MTDKPSNSAEIICGKCDQPLTMGKVSVGYLGKSFDVELLRCPSCGLVYVPEDLAIGRMLQVEQSLEEK